MTGSFRPGAVVLALAALISGDPAHADTSLLLSAGTGHPGVRLSIAGAGFAPSEAIDLYVDTVDTSLLVTSSTGAFGSTVVIPASAGPGQHVVTAIGRRVGDAAQKTYSVTTPWTELGFGSACTAFNPYENTLTSATAAQLGLLWSSQGPAGGGTPAIGGGRVIVGLSGGVEAIAASTGAVLWKKLTSGTFYSSAAVVGNSVYIAEQFTGTLYALNAATGATLWSKVLGTYLRASPVVVAGVIYIGTSNGNFYAVQASTGAILWTYAASGDQFFNNSAAIVGNTVYVGSGSGKIYALNASTGAVLWTYVTGGAITGAPSVVNNVLYSGSLDQKVYAIKAAGPDAGLLLWSVPTGSYALRDAAVASGVVYIGADNSMYAFDARTGAQRWRFQASGNVGSSAVAGGVVYFSSDDDGLYALSASSGNVLASGVAGFGFLGGPAVSDGVLYVSGLNSDIYAFAIQAGLDAARARARGIDASKLRPDLSLKLTR